MQWPAGCPRRPAARPWSSPAPTCPGSPTTASWPRRRTRCGTRAAYQGGRLPPGGGHRSHGGRAGRKAGAKDVKTVAVQGSPVEALDVVRREDADLLVVGNRGLAGIKGRLLGSVPADATPPVPVRRARRPHHRLRPTAGLTDPGDDRTPRRRCRDLERSARRPTALHPAAGGRDVGHAPPQRTQRLWRALGFADTADDDPAFTDADVKALGVLSTLIESGSSARRPRRRSPARWVQSLSRRGRLSRPDMLADALLRAAGPDEALALRRTRRSRPRGRCCPGCVRCRTTCGGGTWGQRRPAVRSDRRSGRSPRAWRSGSPTWSVTPRGAAAWAAASWAR